MALRASCATTASVAYAKTWRLSLVSKPAKPSGVLTYKDLSLWWVSLIYLSSP